MTSAIIPPAAAAGLSVAQRENLNGSDPLIPNRGRSGLDHHVHDHAAVDRTRQLFKGMSPIDFSGPCPARPLSVSSEPLGSACC